MKLTRYTDYSLRVLLYLGAKGDRLSSIADIARAYAISQNHLMKVVNNLVQTGYVSSVRGRLGGIRLARDPAEINIGALVRQTEDGFKLVDCANCIISPVCVLNGALDEAVDAFMAVLNRYSLADLLSKRAGLRNLFGMTDQSPVLGNN